MATIKYLSEFYTTKSLSPVSTGPVVADPSTSLELQIQAHVLHGNLYYFDEKYTSALSEYLAAWGLIPRLIDPFFPFEVSAINSNVLLKLDLSKQLMTAAADIHMFRGIVGPQAPLGGPGDPPPEMQAIAKQFGSAIPTAERQYARGLTLVAAGQFKAAGTAFQVALQNAGQNAQLQLDARAALAVVAAGTSNYAAAQEQFTAIAQEGTRAGLADHSAAMVHNSGVAQTLKGDAAGAAAVFVRSSASAPGSLNWTLTHSVNPGIAAFQRPSGAQGMQMLLSDRQGSWVQVKATGQETPKSSVMVLKDRAGLQLDLTSDPQNTIQTQLLQPRILATTISALDTYYWSLPQFVTYLTHVSGFILPLALGDTYSQLGDYVTAASYYVKVRDYPFLNQAIERPMVWVRLARTYVRLGNRLYRDRDMAGARAQYENVVKITGGAFVLTGSLYTGGFASLAAGILAFLNAPDKLGFTALDFATRSVVLEALANLNQILNNINYLGFPENIVPIHSWRYLQNVARYLTNQAIQMERGYINFKTTAEQEEATRLTLEQSVDSAKAAAGVEAARVKAANDQLAVAQLSAEAAQTRLNNANDRKTDFAGTSKKLALLDEITAWATGPMDEAEVDASWAAALGIQPGDYDTYQVTRYASRARSKISNEYELRNMDRQIAEAQDSVNIANAQVTASQSMVGVALAQQQLADLHEQQAEAQLANFNAEEFTPELWNNLVQPGRKKFSFRPRLG